VSLWVQIVLSGSAAGSVYGLIAIGHTLVHRVQGQRQGGSGEAAADLQEPHRRDGDDPPRVVKHAAATVCAGCVAALAQAASAAPITLLSPNASGSPPPPLAGGQQLGLEPGEVRVPGALSNVEAVRVGLGPDGEPVSVVVVQRMSIRGLGDFRFVIPAPATGVAPAGGSQSMPGLRQAGIVWQGFSPGNLRSSTSSSSRRRSPTARARPRIGSGQCRSSCRGPRPPAAEAARTSWRSSSACSAASRRSPA